MLFSAALVVSAVASVLATGHSESGRAYSSPGTERSRKLYARSEVANPKLGINVHFEFTGTMDGEPTFIKIRGLSGLKNDASLGGPFAYHIHTNPVPADGNCTKTLAHHDPLEVSEGFVCDPAFPQYCQTGDLSGKHGKFNGTDSGKIATFGYSDAYVRFFPQTHSILGRSIVIHSANKTRIACGNITSHLDDTAHSDGRPTYKPSKYVKSYPTAAPVPPGPPVIPFNGTVMTDAAVIAALPYPLPVPALSLAEAVNIQADNITHAVKYANSEKTITQPIDKKIDGTGPFKGQEDKCDW